VSSHVQGGDAPPPPPLDEEERAFRESLEKMVDFVRVEPPKLFLRAFLPAFVLVAVGGHLVAGSFAYAESAPQRGLLLLLAGVLVIACGPSWALFWLIRSMKRDDVYVAMRVDGLCIRLDPRVPERVLAWEALHEVRVDPETDQIWVELTTGEQVHLPGPFSGVTNPQLAARIRDARRLAVWHRLAPRPR
jgi:hypothetical protein